MRKQGRGATATTPTAPATPSPAQLTNDTAGLQHRDPPKRRRYSTSIHSVSSADSSFSKPRRKRVERDATLVSGPTTEAEPEHEISPPASSGWQTSPSATDTTYYTGTEGPDTPLTVPGSVRKPSLDDLGINADVEVENNTAPETLSHPILGPQRPLPSIPVNAKRSQTLEDHEIIGLAVSTVGTESTAMKTISPDDSSTASKPFPHPQPFDSAPIETLAAVLPAPTRSVSPISETSSQRAAAPPKRARELRAIDRNRPVETFSAQDIADIQHAAECLSMFCCNREAFELYTTILKRQLSDDTSRDNTFWYLVIQCAHTASIPEHVVVIQNIIRAELARLQQPQSPRPSIGSPAAINLLLHMLLAFTASRANSPEGVALEITNARTYLIQKGLSIIFQHLPPDDRSLDLPVYRNILRVQGSESCDLTSPVPFEFAPFGLTRLDNKLPLEDWILSQVPGPFELQKNGRMANPCIRSCLSWCEGTLLVLRSTPLTHGIADFCTDKVGIAWAEANALFIVLWEHWVTHDRNPPTSATKAMWMTATQDKMGISATELLLLVCRAIHNSYYPWNTPAATEDELVRRLRKRAEELVQESDAKLSRRILKQYITRNTVTEWPSWRSAVQRLEKARMLRCFENVLLVRFPRLGVTRHLINSVLIPPGVAGLEELNSALMMADETSTSSSFTIVDKAPQLSPTLASSLSSVDLSSFRKTGVSAILRLSKLARRSSSTSSRTRSDRKMTSIAGVSDLSTSLRSMSISGESVGNKASSSRLSVVVSESEGPPGQPDDEGEVDSDRMSVATWQ